MLSLLDQAIAFVKAIHDCIRCVEGDDSRERIILQWDVRLQRTHPPHEFDRVISIAAADMGRENLDPVRFRKRYYDKWVAELRMLRGGYSFDAEARKLIENALLTEAIPVLPITGADIMEEFGLAPGPDVGKLLKRAKGINDAAPCSRAELLAKLKTTGVG